MRRLAGGADDVEDLVLGEIEDRKPVEPGSARVGVAVAAFPGELPRARRTLVRAHAHGVHQPPAELGMGLEIAAQFPLDGSALGRTRHTDKLPTYAAAIAELKAEGKCPTETRHRQVKYHNNVTEADHGKLRRLIRPVRGFKTLKTAYATIKGSEVMRALRKGQTGIFTLQGGIFDEVRIVERAFDLGLCALTEAMALLQDRLANTES